MGGVYVPLEWDRDDGIPGQGAPHSHTDVGCVGEAGMRGGWFQCQWEGQWEGLHITAKELLPIVLACAVWGRDWQGRTVRCLCDNAAVVAIFRSGRSKHPLVAHLMRSLSLFTAVYQVSLKADHLPGKQNGAADALSRGNLPLFFHQVPAAAQEPTRIPQALRDIVVTGQPDWTSSSWRTRCASILQWD